MIICNFGNNYNYELEKLSRLFLPFERIDVVNELIQNDRYAVTKTEFDDYGCKISALLHIGDSNEYAEVFEKTADNFEKVCELSLASCLFECFVNITDYRPQWGILTGVRPARLFISKVNELGLDNAITYFEKTLKVSENKISLLKATAFNEEKIISLSKPNSFSLYISIPFCPSRCSYCSFVSHSVESANDIIPVYLDLLLKEIDYTANCVKDLGLKLETVYIGGGTPTTLTAEQLKLLLDFVLEKFDINGCREFTIEAGRPDTITKDKLIEIKNHNVTRISINPQTLNDNVLENIGRRHTARQFFDSFYLARELGFSNINTDLIAGLPGDTVQSFEDTLDKIILLSPENVTIHSLSMKRASTLTVTGFSPEISAGVTAGLMVDSGRNKLTCAQIYPYYMYRQSKTVGNLENVGYAKPDFEGLYNIFIMDETHTILACGASAATKLKNSDGKIKRIFNFKYPYEYINRFDEQIERKSEIYSFYNCL